jgi:hypothetical protein
MIELVHIQWVAEISRGLQAASSDTAAKCSSNLFPPRQSVASAHVNSMTEYESRWRKSAGVGLGVKSFTHDPAIPQCAMF